MTETLVPLAAALVAQAAAALGEAARGLLLPAAAFAALGVAVKGRRALADARRALPETRVTLLVMAVNVVLAVPLITLASTAIAAIFAARGWHLLPPQIWAGLPTPLVILAAVFAGDFVGYWRHRLEHGRLLWPSHAVHHSDTEMTWLALQRFHPLNFATTILIDGTALMLLGFPAMALVANNLVRHFWGYFIHADLPWTFGPLGRIFVSPAMHRWHHAADRAAYGTNFATVFALFDRMFGTWRVPGPCTAPLGVLDPMGEGAAGQLAHPFRPASYRGLRAWWARRRRVAEAGEMCDHRPVTNATRGDR